MLGGVWTCRHHPWTCGKPAFDVAHVEAAPWLVTERKQEPSKCRRVASNPQEANPCPSRQRIACTEALKPVPNQYLGLILNFPAIDLVHSGGRAEERYESWWL